MLLVILNAFLLVNSTIQACAAGCLKCNTSDECVLSDITALYKLTGTIAEKIALSNCTSINIDGGCLACAEDYYIDSATNKCVAITEDALIDDCIVYSSATSCFLCANGFYLSSNICASVETTIPNCEYYASTTTCLKCRKDYLLYIDALSCIPAPSISNCGLYSFVKCNQCANGYVLNPNDYLNATLRASNATEKNILVAYLRIVATGASLIPQNACEVESTNNCAEFNQSANLCLKCADGYYITEDNYCIEYPLEPLEGCVSYSSAKICTTCISGYYFKSGSCSKIADSELKLNCQTYDGKTTSVKCLKCIDSHFLNGDNCAIRTQSAGTTIPNCATKNANADSCQACTFNYVITTDGLECLSKISDCIEYQPTASGQTLMCIACNTGFYLNKTTEIVNEVSVTVSTCIAGEIDNCIIYDSGNPNICNECDNGFILETNQCIRNIDILGCTDYSSSIFNTCIRCKDEISFNFKIDKKCQMITNSIDKCISYSSGTVSSPVCDKCEPGYSLNDNSCSQISIANCLSISNTTCTACSKGFVLSTDSNTCVQPFGYISDNCENMSSDDVTNTEKILDAECNVCKENTIPSSYLNHFACIPLSGLKYFSPSNSTVDGCLKYNENVQCVQCDMTGSKLFLKPLDSPPSCNALCNGNTPGPYDKVLLQIDTSAGVKAQISRLNVCRASASTANCLIHGPDVTTNGEQICIGCDSSSIAYVSLNETKYSSANPLATIIEDYLPSPFAKYPKIKCGRTADVVNINGTGTATLTSNCQYYVATDAEGGVYGCIKCNHKHSSLPNANGYLVNCELDGAIGPNTYHNLDLLWVFTVSAHTCSNGTQIPFIGYLGSGLSDPTFTSYKPWNSNLGNNATFANEQGSSKTVICVSNSAGSFGISGNYGVPQNCGIGAIQVNTNGTGDNGDNLGSYCAACKPGFMAVSHITYSYVKTSCNTISNCAETTTMFNGCSLCALGYIHKYDDTVDYTVCLTIPSVQSAKLSSCYAATQSETVNTEAADCKVCNKGYILNADGICEKLAPSYCDNGQFVPSQLVDSTHWNWSLWQAGNAVGCNRCNATYNAVKIISNKTICYASSWVTNNINSLASDKTEYIPNCKNYMASDSAILCNVCSSGFVINGASADLLTQTECFSGANLAFCAVASTSSKCLKCISNLYALKSDKCELGNLANCIAYYFKDNNTTLKCATCAPGYYLDTTTYTCIEGYVHNCLELVDNQAYQCSVCQPEYTKVAIGSNIVYCYPNESSLGCGEFEIASGNLGGTINCRTCSDSKTMLPVSLDTSAAQTICLAFGSIQNCKKYDIGDELVSSTFKCLECNAGYYLANNICVARTSIPTKCTEFIIDENKCKTCGTNSYISTSDKECIDYPKGIIGCNKYSNAETCTSCKENRYLFENSCVAVPNPISNCLYYSSDTVCSQCRTGYLLVGNACTQTIASNCLTYVSALACSTCPPGMVLQTADGVTSCMQKTKTGCVEIDINTPYNCLECSGEYYLDAGECQAATKIDNCVKYATKITCAKCNSSYALSFDKASCIRSDAVSSYINSYCVDSQLTAVPICSRCSSGYYFVDGECSGSCNKTTKGCFACKHTSPDVCFMCASGHYQNKEGSCTAFGITDPTENFTMILQAVMSFMVLILVLR